MDDNKRDLVRHLFAEITAALEDAHETASKGQALVESADYYRRESQTLRDALTKAAKLIERIVAITESAKGG